MIALVIPPMLVPQGEEGGLSGTLIVIGTLVVAGLVGAIAIVLISSRPTAGTGGDTRPEAAKSGEDPPT